LKIQHLPCITLNDVDDGKYLRLHCLNVISTGFSTRTSTMTQKTEITSSKGLTSVRVGLLPGARPGTQDFSLATTQIDQGADLAARRRTRVEGEVGSFSQ